jgi:hypothetical protein
MLDALAERESQDQSIIWIGSRSYCYYSEKEKKNRKK